MTSYITINNTEVDPDSPITADLMTKMRDNPIAISEGSSGAPKVSKLALGGLSLGAISSVTSSWGGLTGLGSIKEVYVNFGANQSSTTSDKGVEIRFTNDGGTTWGSAQDLHRKTTTSQGTSYTNGAATIDLTSGVFISRASFWSSVDGYASTTATGTLTVPANCNGFQLRSIGSVGGVSAIACGFGGR